MKRKKLKKEERENIYNKYNGRCAYCGSKIEYKDMQIDHVVPLRIGGKDEISNMLPSCRSCNHYKATLDIEGFRKYLSKIHDRLTRDSVAYRVAERFGIVEYKTDKVKFYFEICNDDGKIKMWKINDVQELTPVEITKMSHCVGLGYKNPYKRHGKKFYKPYRNYYATYVWDDIWNGLAGKGFAKHGNVDDETQETTFWLTRKGLDALGDAIGAYIYDEEE